MIIVARRVGRHYRDVLVPKLCLGTQVLEALLRCLEAELPDVGSQAELGNQIEQQSLGTSFKADKNVCPTRSLSGYSTSDDMKVGTRMFFAT